MEAPLIAFIAAAVIDIPLFILIGKILFGGWLEFWEAIVFWLTPDIFSLLNGEYGDDIWAEFKLGYFIIICGLCAWGEYWLIVKLFAETAGA